MSTPTEHHGGATDHVSRERHLIDAAATNASDLLDLLSAGLAEDDPYAPDSPPTPATTPIQIPSGPPKRPRAILAKGAVPDE